MKLKDFKRAIREEIQLILRESSDFDQVMLSNGYTTVSLYKQNGQWHEGEIVGGKELADWGGQTYGGYLSPEDICSWLSKDYGGRWKEVPSDDEIDESKFSVAYKDGIGKIRHSHINANSKWDAYKKLKSTNKNFKSGLVAKKIHEKLGEKNTFVDLKKWWEYPKDEVMRFVYWTKRQLPPTDKTKYDKNWEILKSQLKSKFPIPSGTKINESLLKEYYVNKKSTLGDALDTCLGSFFKEGKGEEGDNYLEYVFGKELYKKYKVDFDALEKKYDSLYNRTRSLHHKKMSELVKDSYDVTFEYAGVQDADELYDALELVNDWCDLNVVDGNALTYRDVKQLEIIMEDVLGTFEGILDGYEEYNENDLVGQRAPSDVREGFDKDLGTFRRIVISSNALDKIQKDFEAEIIKVQDRGEFGDVKVTYKKGIQPNTLVVDIKGKSATGIVGKFKPIIGKYDKNATVKIKDTITRTNVKESSLNISNETSNKTIIASKIKKISLSAKKFDPSDLARMTKKEISRNLGIEIKDSFKREYGYLNKDGIEFKTSYSSYYMQDDNWKGYLDIVIDTNKFSKEQIKNFVLAIKTNIKDHERLVGY